MKKLKKLLAIISAVAMTAIAFAIPVSADSYSRSYETTEVRNGITYPIHIIEELRYDGIVVTMFDETVPTLETLGIDAENIGVYEYTAFNYNLVDEIIDEKTFGWALEETVAPAENSYEINLDRIMTEDEAKELAKELMLSGKVKNAEVLYNHSISKGWLRGEWLYGVFNRLATLTFTDYSSAMNFSFEKYPEIAEALNLSNLSYRLSLGSSSEDKTVSLNIYGEDPLKLYSDEGEMDFYNIVNELDKTLSEKYEEILGAGIAYGHLVNYEDTGDVASKIDIPWGDATGDDIIDLYDAIEVSKHLMGTSTMNDSAVILADINRDGKTDLHDVIDISKSMLLNYVSMNGDIDNSQQVLADFNNDGIINVADILAVNTEHLADVMGN